MTTTSLSPDQYCSPSPWARGSGVRAPIPVLQSHPTPPWQRRLEARTLLSFPWGCPWVAAPLPAPIPVVGAGRGPQTLSPPPAEAAGKERSPPPEVQGGTVPRSEEEEVGRHLPGCPQLRRHPQGGAGAVREGLGSAGEGRQSVSRGPSTPSPSSPPSTVLTLNPRTL